MSDTTLWRNCWIIHFDRFSAIANVQFGVLAVFLIDILVENSKL